MLLRDGQTALPCRHDCKMYVWHRVGHQAVNSAWDQGLKRLCEGPTWTQWRWNTQGPVFKSASALRRVLENTALCLNVRDSQARCSLSLVMFSVSTWVLTL